MNIQERFLKYVSFPTMSDETSHTCPSSAKQLVPVVRQLREAFPGCEVEIIQEFPHHGQIQTVCNRANHCDEVVFFTFVVGSSYYGDESLTKRLEYLIGTLEDKLAAIVHTGNPYAVEPFQNVRRLLIGFAQGASERSAIRALQGEYTPTYTLPVHFRAAVPPANACPVCR